MDLEFFKQKYGYEVGGIWFPRVTAITDIIAKPGLYKYYGEKESFETARTDLKKAADWGKLAHKTVEMILKGELPEIHPVIRPSIEAFREWLNKHKIRVFDIRNDFEKLVLNKDHFYAGKFDAFLEIDAVPGILDLKTSSGIWKESSLQTAAYFQAFNKEGLKKAQTRWVLRVDQYQECNLCGAQKREKEGIPRITRGDEQCPHQWAPLKGVWEFKEFRDHQNDFKIFLAAKEIWEWDNRYWLNQIENYPRKF